MNPNQLTRTIVGIVLAGAAAAAWGAPVGRVILAAGDTFAVREGREIRLALGSTIEPRDLLRTGPRAMLQVRFTDESIKALRENSELVVEDYQFSGKEDGSEKAIFRLVKGGFRAVTGLIGSTRHVNYSVRTSATTIGIRGTDYAVRDCRGDCGADVKDGLYGSVLGASHGTNRISLTNEAGEFVFGISQHFHVPDAKSAPQRLLRPPTFVSLRPDGNAQAVQQGGTGSGDELAPAGTGVVAESRPSMVYGSETPPVFAGWYPSPETAPSAASTPTSPTASPTTSPGYAPLPQSPSSTPDGSPLVGAMPVNGTLTVVAPDGSVTELTPGSPTTISGAPVGTNLGLMSAEYNTSTGAHNAFNAGTGYQATYDASGILTATLGGGSGYFRNDAAASESGADAGVLAWSRWNNGTPTLFGWGNQVLTADQGFHLVVGVPATSLPSQDGVSFSLIGATRPTETRAGALGGWSVTSGTFTANFLQASLTGNLGLSLSRTGEDGTFAMNFSGSAATGFNSISSTVTRTAGTAALCVTACSGNGTLMFAGTNGTHAGMIYEFNTGSYYVQGAAAFRR